MVNFIVRKIKESADESITAGKVLYGKYFVETSLYIRYKAEVDEQLIADGYEAVIVKKEE